MIMHWTCRFSMTEQRTYSEQYLFLLSPDIENI